MKLFRFLRRHLVLVGVIVAVAGNPSLLGQAQAIAGTGLPDMPGLLTQSSAVPVGVPEPRIMDHPCLDGSPRHLEVCTAYIVNASYESRLPYYKFGRSANQSRQDAADFRLRSRYSGQALDIVRSHVSAMPTSEYQTGLPKVSILSVKVSPDQKRATLTTRETWRAESDSHIYQESGQVRTVRLERMRGLVLHKWIVTRME